jgi:hypothetical protein
VRQPVARIDPQPVLEVVLVDDRERERVDDGAPQRKRHPIGVRRRDQPHLPGESVIEEGELAVVTPPRVVVHRAAGNSLAIRMAAVDLGERAVRVLEHRALDCTGQGVLLHGKT